MRRREDGPIEKTEKKDGCTEKTEDGKTEAIQMPRDLGTSVCPAYSVLTASYGVGLLPSCSRDGRLEASHVLTFLVVKTPVLDSLKG